MEQYDKAVAIDAGPLRKIYSGRMDTLIKAYEGKDTGAILAISEARQLIEAGAPKQEIESLAVKHLLGEWEATGGRLRINADRTASFSNGNTGRWKIEGSDLIIEWDQGPITYKFAILESGESLNGTELIGRKGKWTPISGKRKR